jgi:diaminopimelate decarboxylase
MTRPHAAELAAQYRAARAAGHATEPAIIVHDLGRMRAAIAGVRAAFPPGALHTVAIKANPLVGVLRAAVAAGAGLEAASLEEVHLALATGCPPEHVVYDSPCKTAEELAEALARGVRINADNLDEVERIAALLSTIPSTSRIGLRINPELAEGRIAMTSVGHRGSKFGVALSAEPDIAAAFARHPFLTGLHVHVGSQGAALPDLLEAARRVWALRERLAARPVPIDTFDLGGGLPAVYRDDDPDLTPAAYAAALRAAVPGLFAPDVRLVTEFGRRIQAACGFVVARVEYVKPGPVVVLHVGADLFVRRVYRPHEWHHEFVALDARGELKTTAPVATTLAGPLCFGGDILARDLELPALSPGDHVLVRDAGAYTLAMWSRYCSRAIPLVLGLDGDRVEVLRRRETPGDLVRFWGG